MIEGNNFDPAVNFALMQRLFRDALALPEEARQTFLERACEGYSGLLAGVLEMLEVDARGAPLLDEEMATAAHHILGSASELSFGQDIGPYRLIKLLGEGGMGVVYLAERADFGNPVAIKFLRDAWLSPSRRERFLSEQRLLAPLTHPSIARFYDAGTLKNGTPWFAMEYVEGVHITDYCHNQHCTLHQRLGLFRAICEAVQYAHEHTVIHLDLKPSNILVKSDGSVRLLDFGIAKQMSDLANPADQTRTAFRLMTPRYAAPEQFRGDFVGVYTDVYALGILLYELLTGRTPFEFSKQTPTEAERIIADNEPEKASLATRFTFEATKTEWADLDVLCRTAIQKEPGRRYRIEAFIRDIDRYLKNEPLEAQPDSLGYKTGKFLRRHQHSVLAVTIILSTLITVVAFFVIRLNRVKNEALAQAARSERIKDFMQHLFDSDGQAGPSVELLAVDVLDRGAQEAQRLNKEPKIEGELFQILGGLYEQLGKFDRAATLLNSALRVRTTASGNESKEVAETLISLGSVQSEQGKFAEALKNIRQGLAIETRLLPASDFTLGSSRMILGRALASSGNYKEAIEILNVAILSLSLPGAPLSDLHLAFDALGTAYLENGQFALAEPAFQKSLALARRLYKPSNPLIGEELVNLGSVEFSMEHFPLAEKYYRAGLEVSRAWYGPKHVTVATESLLLGQTLLKMDRYTDAEAFLKQALAIHVAIFGNMHRDVAQDWNALAVTAESRSHWKEAEEDFNRVLAIENNLNGGKHFVAALAMNSLANVKREQKQYARAEHLSRKALEVIGQVLPPDHLYAGAILLGLGKTLLKEKRFREAEPYLTKSYDILSKLGNSSMGTLQETRKALAADYIALKRPVEAQKFEAELARSSNKPSPAPR